MYAFNYRCMLVLTSNVLVKHMCNYWDCVFYLICDTDYSDKDTERVSGDAVIVFLVDSVFFGQSFA